MSNGKGDSPRNNTSQKFRDNFDDIFRKEEPEEDYGLGIQVACKCHMGWHSTHTQEIGKELCEEFSKEELEKMLDEMRHKQYEECIPIFMRYKGVEPIKEEKPCKDIDF